MMCGNDVRTAQAVSERWDKPLGKVLNMPVGYCLVFRRGSQPVYTVLNNPRQYIQEMEKSMLNVQKGQQTGEDGIRRRL